MAMPSCCWNVHLIPKSGHVLGVLNFWKREKLDDFKTVKCKIFRQLAKERMQTINILKTEIVAHKDNIAVRFV